MLTESIARDDVRAVAALRKLQSDSLKINKRLLDDFEITLLDLLDDSGKIFMLDRLTAFIILMTRAIKIEHRFFCLHILSDSISEECKRKFVEQGGLRLLKVWIRISQEEESLEQLQLLIKICKELPFDHGEVRRADIGKSIKKLLKFQMEHVNLQKFHADVNDLIGFWKSEIEKFKFTRDANEQYEIITANTTINTTRYEGIPPTSNNTINNTLERVNIQSSPPHTAPSDHTATTIIGRNDRGTPANNDLNSNATNNKERTNDFVSDTDGSNFVGDVGNYPESQRGPHDNSNNLPLDIDTLEEVYMNDNGDDLDTEFLSFEESSSQYAYKEDEVEEASHLLSQDNNAYNEPHSPTPSSHQPLESSENIELEMDEEDSIANKLSDSTEDLLNDQEMSPQARQDTVTDVARSDSMRTRSNDSSHRPALPPINTSDDVNATELSGGVQLMDWEKSILGITTTNTTTSSGAGAGNKSSADSTALRGVPPSSSPSSSPSLTASPRTLAWGQSIEGRLKAAASAAATSSPSGLLRNSPRQNRSHLRVRFAEDLVQVRTFEVDRIVTSVAAHKIGRASSKEMHRKDSHMDKRGVQGNAISSMNRPQLSASGNIARLPEAIDDMSTMAATPPCPSPPSSETAPSASSSNASFSSPGAISLASSLTTTYATSALGDKTGGVVDHQPCVTCGISDVSYLARCVVTDSWYCNGSDDSSSSHIIAHFQQSGLNTLALPGQAALECGHCGNQNLFKLGIVPGRIDSNYIISCEPCAGAGASSPRFDSSSWAVEQWTAVVQGGVISSQIIGQYSHPATTNSEAETEPEIQGGDVGDDEMDLSKDDTVALESTVSSRNGDNISEATRRKESTTDTVTETDIAADMRTGSSSDLSACGAAAASEQPTGSSDVFDMDSMLELLGTVSQFFTMLSPSELSTIIRIFADDISLFLTVLDETGNSIDEIKLLELTQQLLEKDAAVKAERNQPQISTADHNSSSNTSSSSSSDVPNNSDIGKAVRKTSKFSNATSPPPVMSKALPNPTATSPFAKGQVTDHRKPMKRKLHEDSTPSSSSSSSNSSGGGKTLTSNRSVPFGLRGNPATATTALKTTPLQLLQVKCKFFNTPMGCRYGNDCRFGHFSNDPYSNSMTSFNSIRKKGKAND